jgi:hypothetical protein
MTTGKKTQPQELLESMLPDPPLVEARPEPNEDEKFPTDPAAAGESKWPSAEQQEAYWARVETAALDQVHVPVLKFCPSCGEPISNWKYQP